MTPSGIVAGMSLVRKVHHWVEFARNYKSRYTHDPLTSVLYSSLKIYTGFTSKVFKKYILIGKIAGN